MASKIKVKELATELGVNTKDILQKLRELGVQAKSTVATIDADQAETIRKELSGKPGKVEQREVQPGVIVRRRKGGRGKAKSEASAKEEKKEASAKEKQETSKQKAAEKKKPAKKAPAKSEKPMVKVIKPEEIAKKEEAPAVEETKAAVAKTPPPR